MKESSKLFVILSFLYALLILALGSWWLYLIVKYGEIIAGLTGERGSNIAKMVKWEGATFFTLLILLSVSLIWLFYKDQKKTKGLQAFFASMTHELKTPLASIRLQTEVLKEELEEENLSQRGQTLLGRLIEDTNKLETQMDKILQLSRIEGGGVLNLSDLNFHEVWQASLKRWAENLTIIGDIPQDLWVRADEFAFTLILRNLFENTKNHTKESKAKIEIQRIDDKVHFSYTDYGHFSGDTKKLGELFYKHNSKKGSGIGLYLIKGLTEKMKGSVIFHSKDHLSYHFTFLVGETNG